MLFNSVQYVGFLAAVVLLYWALPRRLRRPFLLVTSYVFYGAWDVRFLGLLLFTTAVDYTVARRMEPLQDKRQRRHLLLISVGINLAVLAYFKYAGFFSLELAGLFERLGIGLNPPVLTVLLPVGVSFFTFQSIGYTVDVYRGHTPACRDLVVYATFVAFFPQLVAGPISRARALIPQLEAGARRPDQAAVVSALGLILRGLARKVVIADPMSPIVDAGFNQPGRAGTITVLIAVLAFAVQIYGDFAAYTDIARGSSRLLGIELVHNFRQPYLARSVTEFWRRWHISLSEWLRDYVYVPLGGNRAGSVRTYSNLLLTMLLGGLWHGPAFTFVIWGGLHGTYLAVERMVTPSRPVTDALPRGVREVTALLRTFALVCLAWVFFRATSIEQAFAVLHRLVAFRWEQPDPNHLALVSLALTASFLIDLLERRGLDVPMLFHRRPALTGAGVATALMLIVVFSGAAPVPFLYFRF